MSSPTPLQSYLGGVALTVPVHALLILNGNVFGISGFLHRAVRGQWEAICAVAALIAGGAYVAFIERAGPQPLPISLARTVLSGLLVGLGSKLANGCTSGHMICGISRFSVRSIVATATFTATGAITARLLYSDLPPTNAFDWSLGKNGMAFLVSQLIPLSMSSLLYFFASRPESKKIETPPRTSVFSPRALAFLATGFQFALALRLSNLTEPVRVLSFLLLPFHQAFDPSLVFLAMGALPLSMILYNFFRGSEKPKLGGSWSVPKGGNVDAKLVTGAAIFGVGWGMAGICPGPGLVNFGRAVASRSELPRAAAWLAAVALGGLLA